MMWLEENKLSFYLQSCLTLKPRPSSLRGNLRAFSLITDRLTLKHASMDTTDLYVVQIKTCFNVIFT